MRILLVQSYGYNGSVNIDKVYKEIQTILKKEDVDLIVFPEAFICLDQYNNECHRIIEDVAKLLDKPILMGISINGSYEMAFYLNLNAKREKFETFDKVYFKHSTSGLVFFDIENYDEWQEEVYSPIILNEKTIQVCICHDMFYPLLMEKLDEHPMSMLINLTGGNVKMSKWNAMLKGRSLEIEGPVLCTMGNRPSMNQKSDRVAFDNGRQLKPTFTKYDGAKRHAYSIFDVEDYEELEQVAPHYSDKEYKQLTMGFKDEDIVFTKENLVDVNLEKIEAFENSFRVKKDEQMIHIHLGDDYDLYKRTFVFHEPHERQEPHVFIYLIEGELSYEDAIGFAKIRAIENRIGVVIKTPEFIIGAKTNRYKDVQLFTGEEFGFDLEHMNGFESVYEKNIKSSNGLNLFYKEKYENLVKDQIYR